MRRNTNGALILAGLILFAGLLVGIIGLSMLGFDFTRLDTTRYESKEHKISDDFDKISIEANTADVKLELSDDEECRAVCNESEKAKFSVSAENGTLTVREVDNRKWYDRIGFNFTTGCVTVYLPRSEYSYLEIETDTGDCHISNQLSFEHAKLKTDTGDTLFYASVLNMLEITTDTGDIRLEDIYCGSLRISADTADVTLKSLEVTESVQLETNTGDILFKDSTFKEATIKSDTGGVTFTGVIILGVLNIETDTGDINLILSDADSIRIKTDTGDVSGSLLSGKDFKTDTSTGDVDLPKDSEGGRCEVTTHTGDIEFSIKSKS